MVLGLDLFGLTLAPKLDAAVGRKFDLLLLSSNTAPPHSP